MNRALIISVHFHDHRYHGSGEWPPAPARLFQALLAGGARGNYLSEPKQEALTWLQALAPPIVTAPTSRAGQPFENFVPNNDLDAKGGDPNNIGSIRVRKPIQPLFLETRNPIQYIWRFEGGDTPEHHAGTVCSLAEDLYQLGRGVDMAWAQSKVTDMSEIEAVLGKHQGPVFYPHDTNHGIELDCPAPGSLSSLQARFAAQQTRFMTTSQGTKTHQYFSQAPKPHFIPHFYNAPITRQLFDLRSSAEITVFKSWPLRLASQLVVLIRDRVAQQLLNALPDKAKTIERIVIGRDADEVDKAHRLRILPIPSIGHQNVSSSIRRVLVEIPPNCPLTVDDVLWAFSGLVVQEEFDSETGELFKDVRLIRSNDETMLKHYGFGVKSESTLWRTVTAAAFPESAARRRIEPTQLKKSVKSGNERVAEENRAATAVFQALRHAGIPAKANTIRVQREPFHAKGTKAETFAAESRFSKERLWHVEIEFLEPLSGPLVIGDGRYLGLGLMMPVKLKSRISAFLARYKLDGHDLPFIEDSVRVGEWLRMGLMGKAKRLLGEDKVPKILSGHDMPSDNKHEHAFYLPEDSDNDGFIDHVTVYAKSGFDKDTFRVLNSITRLWNPKGQEWQLGLEEFGPHESMRAYTPFLTKSKTWVSVTPYMHPWFLKKNLRIEDQIKKECRKRGLLEPIALERLESIQINGRERKSVHFHRFRNKRGLTQPDIHGSFWKLTFSKPISGPLAIGFGCHYGLGMFKAEI